MTKPLVLGLTGSIGMGKSTVARIFGDLGVPVFDADAEVRIMQGSGGTLLKAIEEEFQGTTGPEGVIREKLGAIVFADPQALARLEAIIHPAVRATREDFLREHAEAPLVVFDIPLLFERGGAQEVDEIAVVSAPAHVQRERVLARPGMTAQRFEQILALQMPDAEKRSRADHVIDTGVPVEKTAQQVEELVKKVTKQLPASPAG